MKIFKGITLYIVTAALILSTLVCFAPTANAAADPEIQAGASLLVEKNTGTILYAKNENEKVYPASTTKIMTVLLAVEACDRQEVSLDDEIIVSESAFEGLAEDGTTAGILPGEKITFRDVLYCAMLSSANEACNIIAEHISGDIPSFIALMNTRASQIGCTGTHFTNAHGLSDDNHYTTAYDLYLITATAMDNSLFAEIAGTAAYTVSETNLSSERVLKTTNKLLNESDQQYYYEYATGVKTGYTDSAGFCLVSAAENDELELISVVMNAKSIVLEDGTTQTQSFSESKRLLQWGFKNFSYRTIISTIDLVTSVPVTLGDGADSVILRPASSIEALLDNDIDLEKAELDVVVYSERDNVELRAPISQGDELGEVTVRLDGVEYGTVKLVANSSIDVHSIEFIKSEVRTFFANTYVRLVIICLVIFIALYIAFVISYNIRRNKKRNIERDLARQRIEELRRNSSSTVGKSFEEIEQLHEESLHK